MSTTIGEVNINLRMSLKQFKEDVRNGTEDASISTRKMASEMRATTDEAKGSLMLLGEEVGVHLPRHLTTAIASIPGVGAALSAAFSSVAVIALIEVIAKLVEKVQEWKAHVRESAEAWDKVGAM